MATHISHAGLPYPIRKARFTLEYVGLDADGDPTDPTTPDTEVSLDGAAYADAAEEVTTISGSNGSGYVTLTGAETDVSLVMVTVKVASGPKATVFSLRPRNLPVLTSGTLSAGSAGGGTLGTVLPYDVTNCFIRTTGGTGGGGTGGANNQVRRIITHTVSSGAFTVSPNWETTPSTDTTYEVLLPEGVTSGQVRAISRDGFVRALQAIVTGTVGSSSSTTSVTTSVVSVSAGAADSFKGRILVFDEGTTTAALRGQATDVSSNTSGATPTLTVTALTTAPASGDTFTIQ